MKVFLSLPSSLFSRKFFYTPDTLAYVYLIINNLRDKLQKETDKKLEELRKELLKEWNSKFTEDDAGYKIFAIAAVLNPKTKHLHGLKEEDKKFALDCVRSKLKRTVTRNRSQSNPDTSNTTEAPVKPAKFY